MKKIILATIVGLFSVNGNAQITGGGGETNRPTQTKPTAKTNKKTFGDNLFYLGWGYAKPIGKFGQDAVSESNFRQGKGNMGGGNSFELGGSFGLNKLALPEKMKLSIKVDFIDFAFFRPKKQTYKVAESESDYYSGNYFQNTETFRSGYALFYSLNLGPAFAYKITDRFMVDVNVMLKPTLVYDEFVYDEFHSSGDYAGLYDYAWGDILGFSFRTSVGINVRYRPIYLGLNFNFGKVKHREESVFSGYKMSNSYLDIKFGFNF